VIPGENDLIAIWHHQQFVEEIVGSNLLIL
jgi:hypothetical protein